jgi:hypothetical protein
VRIGRPGPWPGDSCACERGGGRAPGTVTPMSRIPSQRGHGATAPTTAITAVTAVTAIKALAAAARGPPTRRSRPGGAGSGRVAVSTIPSQGLQVEVENSKPGPGPRAPAKRAAGERSERHGANLTAVSVRCEWVNASEIKTSVGSMCN